MKRLLVFLLLIILPVSALKSIAQDFRPTPETESGFETGDIAQGKSFMAVTANPYATETAHAILAEGGTVVDAAIAAQLVLGLVEPQSSGLGGGAFAVYYDAANDHVLTYDGRETAPLDVQDDIFLDATGKPLPFYDAVLSGKSVGVPGTPRLLEVLHKNHGRLVWEDLFVDALALAHDGFEVSDRLSELVAQDSAKNRTGPDFDAYFQKDGIYVQTGDLLINPDYAEILRYFSVGGADIFYTGPLAETITKTVQKAGGSLTLNDLAQYQVIPRSPVCAPYHGYKICSMGQPSSGGLTLLQILGLLEHFPLQDWGPHDVRSWHVIAEASRLAFADRNFYMADPDFISNPDTDLIDPAYLQNRANLIDLKKARRDKAISPGQPEHGTSHLSFIDRYGNALSMTSTIESAFGSHLTAGGFFLNNEMTDFSFRPRDEKGRLIANRIEGGKRPRSSMAPTVVFDPEGKPFLVLGSAGGSRIIGHVAQRIIALIDWNMDLDAALNALNIVVRGPKIEVETGTDPDLQRALRSKGHNVQEMPLTSGLTAIYTKGQFYQGYADPRREGIAMGD